MNTIGNPKTIETKQKKVDRRIVAHEKKETIVNANSQDQTNM
jgi:hypothetical protein